MSPTLIRRTHTNEFTELGKKLMAVPRSEVTDLEKPRRERSGVDSKMTMQPLDGARLKIVRAQEHLDSLKTEIWTYLREAPQRVFSQPARHTQGYAHLTTVVHMLTPILIPAPPLRLSTIIGDVVTNARAALDYIVWELADRYFRPAFDTTNRNDRRVVSFPLVESATDTGFQNRLNCLANRQMPADALTEIQAVQPYNAGYESLKWLHLLVNQDKHRMPLLALAEFDKMTVTLATPAIYADVIKEPATITIPRGFATDSVPLQSDVQMEAEVAVYVTWKNVPMPREPLDRPLEQIIKTVADVIPRFDRFF